MLIAIDFDGTVVEHKFPAIGEPLPHAVRVLKRIAAEGGKLVLWTCREDHPADPAQNYLTQAVEWLREHDIPLHAVNELPPEDEFRDYGPRRKVFAHVYLDDRNLWGFPGWLKVEKWWDVDRPLLQALGRRKDEQEASDRDGGPAP